MENSTPNRCKYSILLSGVFILCAYYVSVPVYLESIPKEDRDSYALFLLWLIPAFAVIFVIVIWTILQSIYFF